MAPQCLCSLEGLAAARRRQSLQSICNNRGGRTVLDQARDNLRKEVASAFEHAKAILADSPQ